MKRFFSIAFLLTAFVSCSAPAVREAVSVIPQPLHLRVDEGHFAITRDIPLYLDEMTPEFERIAAFLNERLATAAGFSLKVEEADLRNTAKPGIWFLNSGLPSEHYYLQVLPERILVEYGDGAGAFYALQTLLQLLPTDIFADHRVRGVRCADGSEITGSALLLATGHSARDIYHLFYNNQWLLEAKPFALGVRVEHPQSLIDDIQYHGHNHSPLLPPAAYSLTTQVDGHGVFSFCMCPGGVIVPAATADGEQVVNGMSNANRNSGFANSGIAVTVSPADVPDYQQHGVLALLRFQQQVEHNAAAATGGGLIAPAQRLVDFCENRGANHLNKTNYMGRCLPVPLRDILPPFVSHCLQQAFRDFDRKMHGFYSADASLLAVESRTSSPVRIPRDPDGQHPQLKMLFPCGEGAGFAGGIVSSALDGINQIDNIYNLLHELPSLL